MSIRVDIIGTVGVPAAYGGFETLAENLLDQWQDNPDLDLRVYCSAKSVSEQPQSYKGAQLIYLPLDANGVSSIPYDVWSILRSSFSRTRTLLVLGVSGAPALLIARLMGKHVVVNVDGLEWKRDKWGRLARAVLKLFERIATFAAHEVVADNAVIGAHIKDSYGKDTALIAYGADHVDAGGTPDEDKLRDLPERYAVKVCRIEPENNVHLVLEAFAEVPNRNLVMVGNWEKSDYGASLKAQFADYPNITILDPIYHGPTINKLRAGAELYVHGHSAGGTNPSLVEAMYLGLPVAAFSCGYNEATTHDGAVYFKTTAELKQILMETADAPLDAIGSKMRDIAEENYVWPRIAKKYHDLVAK